MNYTIFLALGLLFLQHFVITVQSSSADVVESRLAAAAGNVTVLQSQIAPSWVSSSHVRGTTDILWSCILTLAACIYNAIHLNVPPMHEKRWRPIWRKAKWVLTALLAPEIVLYCAISQFMEATALVKELNRIRKANQNSDIETGDAKCPGQAPERFKPDYGFFVVMGGFITRDVRELSDSMEYATLTSKAVLELAREGKFLDISPEVIEDRSKANRVGKGLVCAQVIWFVVQCIARAAAKYPLVLLEVHTMVHVVCALFMYILWWKKPLDISEPNIVDTSKHLDSIALMLLSSPFTDFECSKLLYYTSRDGKANDKEPVATADDGIAATPEDTAQAHNLRIVDETSIESQKDEKLPVQSQEVLKCMIGPKPNRYRPLVLSKRDIKRYCHAAEALRKNPIQHFYQFEKPTPNQPPVCDLLYLKRDKAWTHSTVSLVPRNTNFPNRNFRHTQIFALLGNSLFDFGIWIWCALPVAYGGIHLSAWNFEFPSAVERLLWKIAAICTMAGIPVSFLVCFALALMGIVAVIVEPKESSKSRPIDSIDFTWLFEMPIWVILGLAVVYGGLAALLYLLSRIFLVVESLISLRHVPIGAYAAIPWVQDIPHF